MIQWLTWWRICQWLIWWHIRSGSLVAHFQLIEKVNINRDFLYFEQ